MPKEDKNILKRNHEKNLRKFRLLLMLIWSVCLKIDTCHNNPKKSLTTKITKYLVSGYLLLTHIVQLMLQKTSLSIIEVKNV